MGASAFKFPFKNERKSLADETERKIASMKKPFSMKRKSSNIIGLKIVISARKYANRFDICSLSILYRETTDKVEKTIAIINET